MSKDQQTKEELTKQDIENLITLLGRVELKGAEALGFVALINKLNSLLK